MDQDQFTQMITEALYDYDDENGRTGLAVSTFKDEDLMTTNQGLVVRVEGAEYQLTIIRAA